MKPSQRIIFKYFYIGTRCECKCPSARSRPIQTPCPNSGGGTRKQGACTWVPREYRSWVSCLSQSVNIQCTALRTHGVEWYSLSTKPQSFKRWIVLPKDKSLSSDSVLREPIALSSGKRFICSKGGQRYPLDKLLSKGQRNWFRNTYPLDSDLFGGQHYPTPPPPGGGGYFLMRG